MFRLIPDPRLQRDADNMARFFTTLGLRFGGVERDAIHEAVLSGFQASFRNERSGGGTWARLKPATQRDRAMAGYAAARPILFRSGDYYDSLVDPDDSQHFMQTYQSSNRLALEAGSESSFFSLHEGGTKRMPARSVTDLDPQSERHIGDTITGLLNRLMAREGL